MITPDYTFDYTRQTPCKKPPFLGIFECIDRVRTPDRALRNHCFWRHESVGGGDFYFVKTQCFQGISTFDYTAFIFRLTPPSIGRHIFVLKQLHIFKIIKNNQCLR